MLNICAQGIFQIKYMYAVHVYKWGPGQVNMMVVFMEL